MSITIAALAPDEVFAAREAIGAAYGAAFRIDDPVRLHHFVTQSLTRHLTYPEFRMLAAREENGAIVGFAYGYRSEPGRWWHDLVAPTLTERGFDYLLVNACEFAEFAVLPSHQGRGLGGCLHDAFFAELHTDFALLSTDCEPNPAHQMYLRRGWTDIVPDFVYAGGGRAILMALDVRAWQANHTAATKLVRLGE